MTDYAFHNNETGDHIVTLKVGKGERPLSAFLRNRRDSGWPSMTMADCEGVVECRRAQPPMTLRRR